MFYFNIFAECYESEKLIKTDYFDIFADDYETFTEYLNSCMAYNNGALETLPKRETELKNLIRSLENNDGDDETIRAYKSELSMIRTLQVEKCTLCDLIFSGKYKVVDRSGMVLHEYTGNGPDDVPFDLCFRSIFRIVFDDVTTVTIE